MAAPDSPPVSVSIPEIVLTRHFRAPRALVWQAWTDPRHIVRWWGPSRYTAPHAEIDLRPGGALRFDMQGPDGRILPSIGTIDEVVPEGLLVFTMRMEQQGAVVAEVQQTITLQDVDGGTVLELHVRVLHATEACMGPISSMREGWNQALDKMLSYTVTAAAERELVVTRRYRAPIETVWAAWTAPEHLERWWGPIGFTTTTSRFELAPGGQWVHTMHGPDGTDYPNVVTFREIVPPRRLAYAQSGGRVGDRTITFESTVVFEREEDGTRLTLRMRFDSAADRQVVIDEFGAYEGAIQTLNRLADLLGVG